MWRPATWEQTRNVKLSGDFQGTDACPRMHSLILLIFSNCHPNKTTSVLFTAERQNLVSCGEGSVKAIVHAWLLRGENIHLVLAASKSPYLDKNIAIYTALNTYRMQDKINRKIFPRAFTWLECHMRSNPSNMDVIMPTDYFFLPLPPFDFFALVSLLVFSASCHKHEQITSITEWLAAIIYTSLDESGVRLGETF